MLFYDDDEKDKGIGRVCLPKFNMVTKMELLSKQASRFNCNCENVKTRESNHTGSFEVEAGAGETL